MPPHNKESIPEDRSDSGVCSQNGTSAVKDKAVPSNADEGCSSKMSMKREPTTRQSLISPPATLCVLVMIDMFSVSLVVPLLHTYYKSAGVHSANQREMLSSLFSTSQILGGLLIGALSDIGFLSRRHILLVSFLGSALSYALIIGGGIQRLICSRVIVGLVKQTMTVSSALLAQYTSNSDATNDRAVWMGRLGASTTVAWILGPSFGSVLYQRVGEFAPAGAACGLFLLNSVLAAVLLPTEEDAKEDAGAIKKDIKHSNASERGGKGRFYTNLKTCFSSSTLASVVTSLLLYGWVCRTTSYANMASFYEEKYGIEPYTRGYIKSYQQCLNFVVQSFLVRWLLSFFGGERKAACIASFALAAATLCEIHASFQLFTILVCPIVAVSIAMISVSLRSLLTQVTPKESLGSVLAALDVLQNAASVTVPFYRTFLFELVTRVGSEEDVNADMKGDPSPKLWLFSSFIHWVGFTVVLCWLLVLPKYTVRARDDDVDKKNR
ncbi:predicted protein [Thalassiosira pseudonana CCMP1335]|uniref:Major facilitator superfamily (MFS) profile domain-containing protein n=1 Tax=Thalassiosira pseudonana TaxID=35128 RepID=B8C6N3_THAPS|nr:predicted protein [Thalassiosira pseudonana CCMP1335]EED90835.1 predicted protein [Thalassiosira pseudonana CCMP1335]|eukprot:g1937.t1 g1937   contig11:390143-391630(-)